MSLSPQDFAKFACAYRAAEMVQPDMKIGLGTGSTAAWLVKCLAYRVKRDGLRFAAAATSIRTTELAESLGIKIDALDDLNRLDLTIDGADEFDPDLNLIKGAGAALLVEKIVASASDKMVVITDRSKQVSHLGTVFPVPIEVIQYGHQTTVRQMEDLFQNQPGLADGFTATHRLVNGAPLVTDEGHYIYDLNLSRILQPQLVSDGLLNIPGVVETGLFLGIAETVVIGDADGLTEVLGLGGVTEDGGTTKQELDAALAEIEG
ncbi:MAG: ribose-5-phosphate isomerase RpiA [Pseudomonadota bacterium]